MDNLSNNFHASIQWCPSKGGGGNVTAALREPSELRLELMGQGATEAHHNALPEHVDAVVQVLYAHQVIPVRHVNTTIYAFSDEVLSTRLDLRLPYSNGTNQAMKLMKHR